MKTVDIEEKAKEYGQLDIVFLTLPRLELRAPITAPALLKACVEKEGYKALCLDLNLELWHSLDVSKDGHIWFDTDLTFRHEDLFREFWNTKLKYEAETWISALERLSPRWVGLTLFSQRSFWIVKMLCELLKQRLPDVHRVVGGPFCDTVGPKLFQTELVDAYVVGEGERPIVELLRNNLNYPGINGLPAEQNTDLSSIPIPDYSDFAFELYPKTWMDPRVRDPKRMGSDFVYITGSRGCVRRCEFCDIGSIWPKFRYRSGEHIAEEMRIQNNRYGSRRFLFTDSLINGSVSQLKELCNNLIEFRDQGKMGSVLWQGQFIARPEQQMQKSVYALMKDAGCFFVSIGVESGSEKVRNDMRKMFDNEALDFTIRSCVEHGIEMAWLLLVGYPTETEEDFQATLRLLEKYSFANKNGMVRSVALGPTLDIVPGSPLYRKQEELGIVWDEHGNWERGENTRVVRIERWLRLKQKCLDLGYPVVEKATEHLLQELEKYGNRNQKEKNQIYDHFNEIPGPMSQGE